MPDAGMFAAADQITVAVHDLALVLRTRARWKKHGVGGAGAAAAGRVTPHRRRYDPVRQDVDVLLAARERQRVRARDARAARVHPLLDDALMQAIAKDNNKGETAFTVPSDSPDVDFDLRWFTPTDEVELCGHATLAAGHVLMTGHPLRFATKGGILAVSRRDDLLELDLPAAKLTEVHEAELNEALGVFDSPARLLEAGEDAAILEARGRGEGSGSRWIRISRPCAGSRGWRSSPLAAAPRTS